PTVPSTGARTGETVLLVEDEPVVRSLVRHTLVQRGYRVLEAGSGAEALDRVGGHAGQVDLLITDVVMPGMSGRELADRILAARPGTRVLFISGYTDESLARQGV